MLNDKYRYINIVFGLLLIMSVHILNSCSGGSPSGRRSHQKTNSKNSNLNRQNSNNTTQKNSNTNTSTIPLSELYNKIKPSVFLVYTSDKKNRFQGSGFFVSKDGLAVSNYHVFEGTSQGLEIIETLDGMQFQIREVLDKSKENDYIIFRVNIGNYNVGNPIPIVSQPPDIGEDVFAIGNPHGLEHTLSRGIISGYRKNNKLIQTTTEITHGSSGGPLLNMKGEVVGITTAGLGEANINFAINLHYIQIQKYLEQ